MTDFSRLKQLFASHSPPAEDSFVPSAAHVAAVHRWHDTAFALIRGVLDEAGVAYSIPAIKIALRADMPGLMCGHELTLSTADGRRLVIASIGSSTIHVEALPMIRIARAEQGSALIEDERDGAVSKSEPFTAGSFVTLLERWALGKL